MFPMPGPIRQLLATGYHLNRILLTIRRTFICWESTLMVSLLISRQIVFLDVSDTSYSFRYTNLAGGFTDSVTISKEPGSKFCLF